MDFPILNQMMKVRDRSRFFVPVEHKNTYCKVASYKTSHLEARADFFISLMKVIFNPYVL